MKARILVDIPDKGCKDCRIVRSKDSVLSCPVTGEKVTYSAIAGQRPKSCPMVLIDTEKGIEYLELSVRTYNSLKRAGFDTVGELREASDMDLMRIRGLGRRGLEEIKEKLHEQENP